MTSRAEPRGLLLLCFDYTRVAVDEFNDWYDTEHIPERERTRGILTARRWLGIASPRVSVATYDLESIDALKSPEYLAISGPNLSPWSKRVIGQCTLVLRFEGRQVLPGGALTDDAAGVLVVAGGKRSADHPGLVRAAAAMPGVRRARLYEGTNDSVEMLEMYELASPEALQSPGWSRFQAGLQARSTLVLACGRYRRAAREG